MWHGIQGKRYVTSIENFFTSGELLFELALGQIYATGIVRTNRIGLHLIFKNTIAFNNTPQGTLEWRTHQFRQMNSVV